jgi:hypothetical protein
MFDLNKRLINYFKIKFLLPAACATQTIDRWKICERGM